MIRLIAKRARGASVRAGVGLASLVALAAACGCGGGEPHAFTMPPTPVEVAAVTQGPVTDRFHAVGTIEADAAITVVSELDATIVSLPFREGGTIERGGLIAQLDDAQPRADVERAEAVSRQRESAYERVKLVVEQGAGAAQDLDDAAASLQIANAELALARARLAKTRIVAPFSGALGARRVSPGAFVRAGEAITDLAQLDELRVTLSAPERYLSKLERGASVTVTTTAYPGHELAGKIEVIEPVLDPITRSARIVARVANPGGRLRPGMSADVTAVLSERPNALTIPNESVFVEGDQSLVYVIKPDSTVTRTPLTLGTRLADVVEVLSGLEAGTQVVRTGHQKLYEGSKVMPVTSQTPAANPAADSAAGTAAHEASDSR